MKKISVFAIAASLMLSGVGAWGESVSGVVKDASGSPVRGVMVSAIVGNYEKSVSVLSAADGTFTIDGLASKAYDIRGRFVGLEDTFIKGVKAGSQKSKSVALNMDPAENINLQRTGDNLLGLIKFDSIGDKETFKMFCMGCHQVGTIGFRSPEEPVDWETMVTRMDGYGGLNEHMQETIVARLLDAYADEAMADWPEYTPPAPADSILDSKITEWDVGLRGKTEGPLGNDSSLYREPAPAFFHDMELGNNGLVYAVDGRNDAVVEFNPETDEMVWHIMDGFATVDQTLPGSGIHSIEADGNGDMWLTLSRSGEMAKFDVTTKEFTIMSGAPAPMPRGGYPHTLRIAPKTGLIWYTDAGREVYSMSPNPPYQVKEYKTLSADQAVGGGRGESAGRTPYGLDIAPNGHVWYSKLNGNRIGRVKPEVEDGDLKEWNPPFRGPRRLHVDPDGMVWVPAYGSGVIGRFDPKTEEWKIFPMPDAENRAPYALNIDPRNGDIWVCGTGSDALLHLNPKTGHFTEYLLPSRVTYTREIEIGEDGSIWTTNSNGPLRHIERGLTSFIKLEPGI